MGNLTKREKTLLLTLCILILWYFYYTYIFAPQLNNLKTAKTMLNNSKTKLSSLQEYEKNMDKIKKQVDDLSIQAGQSLKSIPDTSRIPELIMYLNDMTVSSGCEVGKTALSVPINKSTESQDSMQPNKNISQQTTEGGVMVLPITYNARGNYNSIILLLSKIESSDRKMVVDKLVVSSDTLNGKLYMNININCYYLNKDDASRPIDYPFINNTSGKQDIFN